MERAGRGGGGRGGGRGGRGYMKGRLPEGVDFAAYPGRSSTPLPTAESKGAERINQLKIWNEAATNDDKRGLKGNLGGKQALAAAGSGSRRTDSFKDAKNRHSASFTDEEKAAQKRPGKKVDMFADRSDDSDDESEDEEEEEVAVAPPKKAEPAAVPPPPPPQAQQAPPQQAQEAPPVEVKAKGGCCVVM